MTDRTVLSELDILRALKRIAHEILEANSGPEDLLIVGIPTRGAPLAERICKILKEIEPAHSFESGVLDITLYRD
ncbi:MAG TPA: bifunctional pyr operon transcriptional regulator/uracil phosphoribosyltransferase, partial [Candidatus Aquiluna sp.]|nr:bifunctional pyr operon transcriptional regulator/uracil phosphoribosyltransferase [Aquiluna sp.]